MLKRTNKLQAIEMAASALEQAGNVEQGYLQGMLGREQQTSTFFRQWDCDSTRYIRNPFDGEKKLVYKCSNFHKVLNGEKAILLIL